MKTGKKVLNRKNKNIFFYQNKNYKYDDIYNLIKTIDYDKKKVCDYKILDVIDCVTNKKAICIMFQQTNGKLDWLHNLSFFPIPKKAYKGNINGLKYHGGFYLEYKYARDTIIKEVNEKISNIISTENIKSKNDIKIFVTGWSLGGSIAPICCEDIYFQFSIKPTLIAYEGANPCFGLHTRNYLNNILADDSICFVYGYDVVTRVPPFLFGFFKLKPFIKYFKEKKKLPFLLPIIRHLIWFIKDTYRTHTETDKAIQKYMENEDAR